MSRATARSTLPPARQPLAARQQQPPRRRRPEPAHRALRPDPHRQVRPSRRDLACAAIRQAADQGGLPRGHIGPPALDFQLDAAQLARRCNQSHPRRQRVHNMSSAMATRPAPARHTSRSRSGSAPASPATACASTPRPNGSPGSRKPSATAGSRTSCTALGRIPLLIVDEVGYIPFDPQAANLMFALVSSRYERASMIVTSNKPFSKAHRFE